MRVLACPSGKKQWHLAYAGTAPNVRTCVCGLCSRNREFRFCGQTASTTQLVREVLPQPDIVLNRHGLTELQHLHQALPSARTLLIGDSVQPSTMRAAIRLGTWGVLAGMRVATDLDRAIHAVASGELWLSRRQIARVVAPSSDLNGDFTELTARENAVTHRVLLGRSNKQIARELNIAEHTVKIHLHHAYGKLRVHNRVELLLHYRRGSDSLM